MFKKINSFHFNPSFLACKILLSVLQHESHIKVNIKIKRIYHFRHHSQCTALYVYHTNRTFSDEFRLFWVWNHVCQDGHFFNTIAASIDLILQIHIVLTVPFFTDTRQLVHLPGIGVVTHVVARDEIGPKRTNDFSLGHSER